MKGLAAGVPAIVVLAGMAAAGALLLASVLRYPVMIRQPGPAPSWRSPWPRCWVMPRTDPSSHMAQLHHWYRFSQLLL